MSSSEHLPSWKKSIAGLFVVALGASAIWGPNYNNIPENADTVTSSIAKGDARVNTNIEICAPELGNQAYNWAPNQEVCSLVNQSATNSYPVVNKVCAPELGNQAYNWDPKQVVCSSA